MNNGYVISTDKSKLDIEAIHNYLCNRSYWAQRRTIEAVQKGIDNSQCFGMYNTCNQLVGFARVVTDFTVFAYLMDLFILETHRKRGLGKQLVNHILNDQAFKHIQFWRLDTKDAHDLYRRYGFREPAFPKRIMEIRNIEHPAVNSDDE